MLINAAFLVGSFWSFLSALLTSLEGSTEIPGFGLFGLLADEIAAPTPAPTPAPTAAPTAAPTSAAPEEAAGTFQDWYYALIFGGLAVGAVALLGITYAYRKWGSGSKGSSPYTIEGAAFGRKGWVNVQYEKVIGIRDGITGGM